MILKIIIKLMQLILIKPIKLMDLIHYFKLFKPLVKYFDH